jgi:hypothetical protein
MSRTLSLFALLLVPLTLTKDRQAIYYDPDPLIGRILFAGGVLDAFWRLF